MKNLKLALIPFCFQTMSRKTRQGARSVFKYVSTPSPKFDALIERKRIGITSLTLGVILCASLNSSAEAAKARCTANAMIACQKGCAAGFAACKTAASSYTPACFAGEGPCVTKCKALTGC